MVENDHNYYMNYVQCSVEVDFNAVTDLVQYLI